MKGTKLQFALSFIPFFGFIIVLFWGMVRMYRITGKRSYGFRYGLLCLIPLLVLGGAGAASCYYLILAQITRENIPLILALSLCFLCLVCWLIAGVCLFIQDRYAQKVAAREHNWNEYD